jgi:serine O-acetyltransferase
MIFKHFREDVDVVLARDPAARSRLEVMLCYPGLHALLFHRLAHRAWQGGWRVLGRFLSHLGRLLTGIEIHPGATIGRRVFIDHGMGVVIGETSEVGSDVTLYQGVTLGGTSLEKGKRHPTLEDGVIVGAGAKILGPLIVGAGARVGSNAVVLKPVAAGATVVGIPAREVVQQRAKSSEFCAYGSSGDLPDPVARALDSVCADMVALRRRVAELEEQLVAARTDAERRAVPLAGVAGERARLVAVKGDER